MEEFKFDPVDGWEDASGFPTNPDDETATRTLFQKLYNQIRDFINTKIVAGHNAHLADNVNDADGAHGLKAESGIWTPIISNTSSGLPAGYSTQVGQYYKIGNLVRAVFVVQITGVGTLGTTQLRIKGLPFIVKNSYGNGATRYGGIALPAGVTQLTAIAVDGGANLRLDALGNNLAITGVDASALSATTLIGADITYEV